MDKQLICSLPQVRGIVKKDYNLRHITWLKIGGNAEVFFCPVDTDDLRDLLKKKPQNLPITVIGNASNLLIREGGIKGIVIHLGDWFKRIYRSGETFEVGAAASCRDLSKKAAECGIGGFEFLHTIPGSVGGALKMNAGCFGSEIKDVFVEAESMTENGLVKWFNKDNLKFDYRKCYLPEGHVFTRIWLKGQASDINSIEDNIRTFEKQRLESHPIGTFTCGSLFKNPPGHKAWQLIEKAGCRGIKNGGASLSEVHCNFLINDGSATSKDVDALIDTVKSKVFEVSGIVLETELVILGEP